MKDAPFPKLYINASPGFIINDAMKAHCRRWVNQTELKVRGTHFCQEDSPTEIGEAIALFIAHKGTIPQLPASNVPPERPEGLTTRFTGETLRVEYDPKSGIALLELSVPKSLNALNLQMAKELAEVAADLDADRGVRCVLLRGQGRAFCAGGDLASIHEAVQKEGTSGGALKLKEMMGHLHMAILTLTLIGMR